MTDPRAPLTNRRLPHAFHLAALACLALAATPLRAADVGDETAEERFVVVKARRIITNTGKPIENGVIVIVNGKIRNVGGSGLEYPRNAKIIDAHDRVVMPGLICPQTRFGLPPYGRQGVHGNWSVADEFFPREDTFDDLLDAGFTAVALVPDGSGIPGRALIVRTGGPLDQRILKSPAFVLLNGDKKTIREALERAEKEIEKVTKAREKFEEEQKKAPPPHPPASQPPGTQPAATSSAPASAPVFKPPPIDPAHEVLADLIQKKDGVEAQVELRRASDWVHMADLFTRFDIARHYVARNVWQSDFYRVAKEMGEKKVRVALWPYVNRIPFSNERVHTVRELSEAGCEVSLLPVQDNPAEFARIRQRASQLVAAGWKAEDALKSLTLHPARLLGLADRFGTIEKDREADLIFLTAEPLAPESRVREVMIRGEIVHRVKEE
jgi:hypothetical protein